LTPSDHERRNDIAFPKLAAASSSATTRGSADCARDCSMTAAVLSRIVWAISSNGRARLSPAYSALAQMTPPALTSQSGRHSTPRSCSGRLRIGGDRDVRALEHQLRLDRVGVGLEETSGLAAGTRMSQSVPMTESRSSGTPAAKSQSCPRPASRR
jgi:hypothetical protein